MSLYSTVAKLSSVSLRLAAYAFLRWILLPWLMTTVFTSFAIYVTAFVASVLNGQEYGVLEDEVDMLVTETAVKANGELVDVDEVENVADGEPVAIVEEVEVQETVIVGPKKLAGPLEILLTGVPNPRRIVLSGLTFFANLGLVAMVADRVFSERNHTAEDLSFVRIGYISDNEVKVLIREPDQAKMPVTVALHIKDARPPYDNPLWQTVGGVTWTGPDTDYTAVLNVPLRHSRQRVYEWRSSNNHTGEFTAAPKAGRSPELHNGAFTFLSTSCLVSRLPYNPSDHPLAIPGLRHLAKLLPSLGAQFMLFLGDFIYADVPRFWGSEVSDYRQKYRQIYASPDWPAVGQNLSWIHVLDDHEIANDWSANTSGVYQNAVEPWHHYHTAANPPVAKEAGSLTASRPNVSYFEFTQGPATFFMLDTRTYRSSNLLPADIEDKTMLGEGQLADFLHFLARPEPQGVKWKIVASSVPFTKNWRVNQKDTWGGFLSERRKVLEAMWDAGARGYGVIVLSGDRHEFAATKFPPPEGDRWPDTATVHEFSASPLSQFYSPVPSYFQTDAEDVMVKYTNKGNSKFGAITIETLEEGDQSSLKYRLFVDGKETWNTVILSPPVVVETKRPSSSFWDRFKRP